MPALRVVRSHHPSLVQALESQLRTLLILCCLGHCHTSFAADVSPIGGIYVDTLNKLNVKAGITLNAPFDYNPDTPYYYGKLKYADLELGLEGQKLSVGTGRYVGHGMDRIGLSYAHLKTQDLAGIETVFTQMAGSIKLGYYLGLNDTDNKFLFGFGFGL